MTSNTELQQQIPHPMLEKYSNRLSVLKENRANEADTLRDYEVREYDHIINLTSEMCRDVKELLRKNIELEEENEKLRAALLEFVNKAYAKHEELKTALIKARVFVHDGGEENELSKQIDNLLNSTNNGK